MGFHCPRRLPSVYAFSSTAKKSLNVFLFKPKVSCTASTGLQDIALVPTIFFSLLSLLQRHLVGLNCPCFLDLYTLPFSTHIFLSTSPKPAGLSRLRAIAREIYACHRTFFLFPFMNNKHIHTCVEKEKEITS